MRHRMLAQADADVRWGVRRVVDPAGWSSGRGNFCVKVALL